MIITKFSLFYAAGFLSPESPKSSKITTATTTSESLSKEKRQGHRWKSAVVEKGIRRKAIVKKET